MQRSSIAGLVLASALAGDPVSADAFPWSQFRGPNGSGVAEGCKPPVELDQKLVAWKTPVPPGLSSPVVCGDKVVLTGLDEERLVTLAFDKQSGDLAWRAEAPEVPLEDVHKANSPASPTPLADDERVYVYFGSYGLLCYDHQGKELWKKPLPTPKSLYGATSSPIAHGDNLILVIDNDANLPDSKLSQSKIIAVRKATGDQVWEAARPFVRSGWSTPSIWTHDAGTELVVLGSGRVDSYDPESGEENWYATGFSRETIAVPVHGDGSVYISSAQLGGGADAEVDPEPFWKAILQFDKNRDGRFSQDEISRHFTWPLRPDYPLGHPGWGLPLPEDEEKRKQRQTGIFGWVDKDKDGAWTKEELVAHLSVRRGKPRLLAIRPGGKGDVTESHVAWELNRSIPEIPSPLFYDGRLYLVRNGGTLAAVDAENGKQLYRGRLGGGGGYSASPVIANGHLYLLSDEGVLSVVKAGEKFEFVHHHDLGEPASVTPAIDENTLYVRGKKHLYAFRN